MRGREKGAQTAYAPTLLAATIRIECLDLFRRQRAVVDAEFVDGAIERGVGGELRSADEGVVDGPGRVGSTRAPFCSRRIAAQDVR